MAVKSSGLQFFPLFWRHDGCWKWRVPVVGGFIVHQHYGHTHFWMSGFDFGSDSQDAFFGQQTFSFELGDVWGPRSEDPNQQQQYRVIGTPRWYFHVQEIWRRVYIQQFDAGNAPDNPDFLGKHGIKYDASLPLQTFGPFREGQGYSPYFIQSPRTLPVEYFTSAAKDRNFRDNYVLEKYRGVPDGQAERPFDAAFYVPPSNGSQPLKGQPGGRNTYADGLYIHPTLEYQKVVQLDWERLPGYQAKNDKSPTDFGDGWALDVTIPFTDPLTGQYRSPFGATRGVCDPPGTYHHDLVPLAKRLRNRARDYAPPGGSGGDGSSDYYNRPFGMSEAASGQLMTFQNPYPDAADGRWVQQCVGGIVQAKAKVTIEHKTNQAGPDGFEEVWVHATQYLPADVFAGSDQAQAITPA